LAQELSGLSDQAGFVLRGAMDPQTEPIMVEDAEMAALIDEVPTRSPSKRRLSAWVGVAAAALLAAAALSVAGHRNGSTSRMDALVMKMTADKDCDTSGCSDDEFPNVCAGKMRVACCTDDGGDKEACCLKEGKTNPDIYTTEECRSTCDEKTPCKDEPEKTKTDCENVEKVKCCTRTSDRITCCDSDGVSEAVKNGPYCRPKCDPDRVCSENETKDECIADQLAVCEAKKKCTVNVPGKGVSCLETGCCQDPSMACYEKNQHWAECRTGCAPGNQSDDHPDFRSPWTCRVVSGCSENWAGCLQSKCCRNGFTCYAKNPHWAQCRKTGVCEPGIHAEDPRQHQTQWACKAITAENTTLSWDGLGLQDPAEEQGCAAPWGPCLGHKCCKSVPGKNFTCYAKNPHWAQCRETGNCAKGIHQEDPEKHRTEWACKAIDKTTAELTWEGLGLQKPEEDDTGDDNEGASNGDSDKPE